MAKEVLTLMVREAGASVREISELTGLDSSSVSRRYDAARGKLATDTKLLYVKYLVEKEIAKRIAAGCGPTTTLAVL
jgi:hypothetical protein